MALFPTNKASSRVKDMKLKYISNSEVKEAYKHLEDGCSRLYRISIKPIRNQSAYSQKEK